MKSKKNILEINKGEISILHEPYIECGYSPRRVAWNELDAHAYTAKHVLVLRSEAASFRET